MKRLCALMLVLCMAMGPAACPCLAEETAAIVLPEPEIEIGGSIIGDYAEMLTRDVALYYPGEDGDSLTTLTLSVHADRGKKLIEAVLFDLMETTAGRSPNRFWSPEIDLIGVEYACGTVTVNLSLSAAVRQNDFSYLLLCRSIANTLLQIEGVSAVNILTAGQSEMLCRLPLGVFTQPSEAVSAEYAILQNEENRFLDEKSSEISRHAMLYFPARDGRYILPEAVELRLGDENYISALLLALSGGPSDTICSFSAIPSTLQLLNSEASVTVDESGRRIAELDFSEMVTNYLAFSGTESWQLYASVVLSICSFVPEIDGIRIIENGMPVSECLIGEDLLRFEDSVIRREDFAHLIGSSTGRYYANAGGSLTRINGAVSQSGAASAKTILTEMITDRSPAAEGLTSVFPAEIVPGDVLGVRIENDVANVNLSAGFYSSCQSLDADQERLLIFAMVNALCELEQVGSVRFWIEGRTVDSLSQSIYLKSALMPNPGLVQTTAPEE